MDPGFRRGDGDKTFSGYPKLDRKEAAANSRLFCSHASANGVCSHLKVSTREPMAMMSTLLRPIAYAVLLLGATLSHADVDYPTQVTSTANLVGYWQFNTTTQADSSVNGYTGSFLDNAAVGPAGFAPTFVGVSGNYAAALDGSNDGVLTNLAAQVAFPTASTIVAWIYLDAQPSTTGRTLYIAGRSQNGNDMDFQLDLDNELHFYTDSGGSAAGGRIPLQQWVMVAGTFDTVANTRAVYIDGILVNSNTPGPHSANNAPFSVGYSTVWGNRWFPGGISDVAIFDRALTADEIQGLEQAAGDLIFRSGFEY
jgi:hypothetical protein